MLIKFEYCIYEQVREDSMAGIHEYLTKLGEEGWELCGVLNPSSLIRNARLVFKRQKYSPVNPIIHPGEFCYCNSCYASRVVSGKE